MLITVTHVIKCLPNHKRNSDLKKTKQKETNKNLGGRESASPFSNKCSPILQPHGGAKEHSPQNREESAAGLWRE